MAIISRRTDFRLGQGRAILCVEALDTGDGLIVVVLGGDKPHVGAVSAAPGGHSIVYPGHRDGDVADPIAQGLWEVLGIKAVVTAGIHIDGITGEEIRGILALCPDIVRHIREWYEQ